MHILELFGNHLEQGFFRRESLGVEHFNKAKWLIESMATGLCTLDALHLAAVVIEGIPLLTADRQFAGAARKVRVKTTLVR
jgi:predicted nucleic acid-binding protein